MMHEQSPEEESIRALLSDPATYNRHPLDMDGARVLLELYVRAAHAAGLYESSIAVYYTLGGMAHSATCMLYWPPSEPDATGDVWWGTAPHPVGLVEAIGNALWAWLHRDIQREA